MSDNTTLNAMAGGDVIAADDVGGVKYQIIKITIGALDAAGTLIAGDAGTSSAGTQRVVEAGAATGTLTNVASSASNVTILSAAATRRQAILYNDSTQDCYVKFGTTASATSFTYYMPSLATIEIEKYNGRIDAIWVSANGNMRVTEIT
jgi:hypothetical protein